jgi:two-component system, OmpR family, osmolarity sensor histidine kinase EnvZ
MAASLRSAALLWRLGGFFLGGWGLSLLLLQMLLGSTLGRSQIDQMGPQVALNLRLSELALERFPPSTVSQLSGLQLGVGQPPRPRRRPWWQEQASDALLDRQASQLQLELCRRLPRCPVVVPTEGENRGVWIELASPLEPVWLYAAIRPQLGWPPDPQLVTLSLVSGSIMAAGAGAGPRRPRNPARSPVPAGSA